MRQEQYFLGHKRYAETLTELSYPTDPYAVDAQGNVVGELAENKIYLIDLATRTNAYTLFAVPQSSQEADNACGILSLDSSGAKSVSGDGPGWRCW